MTILVLQIFNVFYCEKVSMQLSFSAGVNFFVAWGGGKEFATGQPKIWKCNPLSQHNLNIFLISRNAIKFYFNFENVANANDKTTHKMTKLDHRKMNFHVNKFPRFHLQTTALWCGLTFHNLHAIIIMSFWVCQVFHHLQMIMQFFLRACRMVFLSSSQLNSSKSLKMSYA